jgi:hypothetical protein
MPAVLDRDDLTGGDDPGDYSSCQLLLEALKEQQGSFGNSSYGGSDFGRRNSLIRLRANLQVSAK